MPLRLMAAWLARRREAAARGVRFSRRRAANRPILAVEVRTDRTAAPRLLGALCSVAAEVAATYRMNVATLGLMAGEAPRVSVRAPLRDLISDAVESHLIAGPAHRVPSLWLLLKPGTYLAEVVDPNAPLEPDDETVCGWLEGSVEGVARLDLSEVGRGLGVRWTLYGSTSFRRCVLSLARSRVGRLSG